MALQSSKLHQDTHARYPDFGLIEQLAAVQLVPNGIPYFMVLQSSKLHQDTHSRYPDFGLIEHLAAVQFVQNVGLGIKLATATVVLFENLFFSDVVSLFGWPGIEHKGTTSL